MLAALTATAVSRSWPPMVFCRLVSQLCDSSNISLEEQASELFTCLTSGSLCGPLQFEYVTILSKDSQSVIYFPVLLAKFASIPWKERSPNVRALMSYLARAAPTTWSLNAEYKDVTRLCTDIGILLNQALEGCEESRFLVSSLTYTNVITILNQNAPNWQAETSTKFQTIRQKYVLDDSKYSYIPSSYYQISAQAPGAEPAKGPLPDVGLTDTAENSVLRSSRSLRFLWLDWLLRTSQNLDSASLKKQLDLMWPGDRIPVISYELCVTAFDVVAAPASYPNAPTAPALARAFIVKRLPLILRQLTLPEFGGSEKTVLEKTAESGRETVIESSLKNLDGVIARVFTTMDKEVVEAVEQRHPGLREDFGISCVDLGLCDPTVLHALHRSYNPQPQTKVVDTVADFEISTFQTYNPEIQSKIARKVLESARGINEPMGRHKLAELCVQMYKNVNATDEFFVHASVRDFLESVCVNADSASTLAEEEACSGLIYDDIGIFLGSAMMLAQRYNVPLPEEKAPWSTNLLRITSFVHATELSHQKQNLMGQWIVALFSKSSGGITDDLFRPFNELADVLPALITQAVKAYQSGVIDRDVLKNGLEHFANPYMAKLTAPLILRVLHADILQTVHESSTALECVVFLLEIFSQKHTNANGTLDVAISYVLMVAKQILNDMNVIITSKGTPKPTTSGNSTTGGYTPSVSSSNTELKLVNILFSLVSKLTQQIQPQLPLILQKWTKNIGNGVCSGVVSFNKDEKGETPGSTYAKPTSCYADAVKTAVSALMGWQTKPHGIPAVPSVIVSVNAKPLLGVNVTKEIIEHVCFPQSPETAVAVLVADGLLSKTSRVVDAEPHNNATDAALNFLNRLETILSERDSVPSPDVVVIMPDTQSSSAVSGQTGAVNTNQTTGQSAAGNNPLDLPTNLQNTETSVSPSNAPTTLGMPFEMDMIDDQEPGQGLDFDADFASQPMNLEDLDSAMDFGWD